MARPASYDSLNTKFKANDKSFFSVDFQKSQKQVSFVQSSLNIISDVNNSSLLNYKNEILNYNDKKYQVLRSIRQSDHNLAKKLSCLNSERRTNFERGASFL